MSRSYEGIVSFMNRLKVGKQKLSNYELSCRSLYSTTHSTLRGIRIQDENNKDLSIDILSYYTVHNPSSQEDTFSIIGWTDILKFWKEKYACCQKIHVCPSFPIGSNSNFSSFVLIDRLCDLAFALFCPIVILRSCCCCFQQLHDILFAEQLL